MRPNVPDMSGDNMAVRNLNGGPRNKFSASDDLL